MNVGALVRGHERFAQETGAEVRNDHRHLGEARGNVGERQRIAEPQIERRGEPEPLAYADREHAAVDEHRRAACRGGLERGADPLVGDLVVVHRREQADGSQVPVIERPCQPLRGVVRRGIQHEEADQPRRMPGNRRGDRLLVAGDAGDQGGAGDVMLVELRHPAIGQRIGRARRFPAEQRGHDRRMITGRDVAPILGQDLEKPRREEMTVDVADLHGRILDRRTRAVESESAARVSDCR